MGDGYPALETPELMSGFSLIVPATFAFDQRIEVDAEVPFPAADLTAGVSELAIVATPGWFVGPTNMKPDCCFGHSLTGYEQFLNSGDKSVFAVLWGLKP
jgi:hypothetical protein